MATELGQAYVQIIPSAKGIKGSIEKELGGEATSAGKSAGSTIASTIKKVIAVAAIGKAIGTSLMAGGALQQSLGGVETLFKENADKVKQYANEAYKTAGLSANDYMSNVTSFSASLLQSLGGDTEKAADKANTAMIDMSDNSNKMGTSMESIQTAYQGFAKQNYTMLDNLKLGYGGTKTEMERLLTDAEKLTGVKYDINNLADVYDAIHAVQGELGITGTTAKESAETLGGSFAAMKSSFTNFLGNLSLGQDIKPSMQALAETVSTFLFGNFLPMVGNILKALPEAIVTFFQAAAPRFIEAGSKLIEQISSGVTSVIPNLLTTLETIVTNIMAAITEKLPQFLDKGIEIIKNIANGIFKAIPQIIESAGNIIRTFIEFIMSNLPKILASGKDLVLNLVGGIISNLPAIVKSAIQAIGNFIDTLIANLPQIIKTGIKIVVELVNGIIDRLPDLIKTAITLIGQFVAMLISKLPDILAAGKDILNSIVSGIGQIASNLYDKGVELMKVLVDKIKEKISDFIVAGKNIVEGLWEGITGAKDWLLGKITGFADSIARGFKEFFGINSPSTLMMIFGLNIVQGFAEGIINNENIPLNAIQQLGAKMAQAAQNAVNGALRILSTAQMGQMTKDLKVLQDYEDDKTEKRLREDMGDDKYDKLYSQGVDENGLYTNSKVGARKIILESMSNYMKAGYNIDDWKNTEHGQFWANDKYTNRYGLTDNEFDVMKDTAKITQNIVINSPQALSPSAIAKETKKAAQNAVLPLLR